VLIGSFAGYIKVELNRMPIEADLNIAEIPYESGAIRYRYSRVMSDDGTRWLRHGLFVEYAESGAVVSEGTYVFGQEHGKWRDFHPNGQIAAEGLYDEGKEEGAWLFWDEFGKQERATSYEQGQERV
jgi:antitoxin component YwqK of YwqJK toxin-antitoxin module